MRVAVGQSLWLVAPILLAGLTHVFVIKRDLFAALGQLPLDGGLRLGRRRLLGENKTVRGALVMVGATAAWTVLLESGRARLGGGGGLLLCDYRQLPAVAWGALLGLGYILGELPNSFLKRRLGIRPGAPAPGWARPVFWVADQADSLIGVLAAVSIARVPPAGVVVCLLALTLLLHPAVAALMVTLRLKDWVG